MSPEVDKSSMIGLVEKIRAEGLKGRAGREFTVQVDPADGAPKWCDAQANAATQRNHDSPTQARPVPSRSELMDQTRAARKDRQEVPVIVETEGPSEKIDSFLAASGINVEFVTL